MSLLKYKIATADNSEADIKKEAIDWLREYNLDDIRATFAVRDYIRSVSENWK
jgi:predicted RecB family nuclease